MSIRVKFDTILGRLREADGDDEPVPGNPFTAEATPDRDQTWEYDAAPCPGMTVVVRLRLYGTLVDADQTPTGWEHVSTGVYRRGIQQEGTVPQQAWSHTSGGMTYNATSPARSLSPIYPAYWGIYPSDDAAGDIAAVVAALKDQHRLTAGLSNAVYTVDNCWLWIVTQGAARATDAAFDLSLMRAPVGGKQFASPMPGASWNLTGYNAYVSVNPADAGLSFGNVKLTVNL